MAGYKFENITSQVENKKGDVKQKPLPIVWYKNVWRVSIDRTSSLVIIHANAKLHSHIKWHLCTYYK